ncbi:hypothetical protein KKC32_05110 [Patescibacteria group bacterium]|nr:hypothetical protein [Patescibacteria group bacterium]
MEIKHDIALRELFIPSKQSDDNYSCENFIIYPEGKEKNGGYLFGIIEMRATPKRESEKIIKTLINTLKEKYYDQIKASPDPQKLNIETIFEHALQKTNETLTELIEIGHLNFVLENLNYLIAAAKPHIATKEIDLFFSHQGLIQAYILHKTKQNNFKAINIINSTPTAQNAGERLKIFSSILGGKIYYNDTIYIASEIFNNYIPAHKVNKIMASNDFGRAIDYFKGLINNVKNSSYLTHSAIFVKMEEKRFTSEKPISQKSIAQFISTKETTEKYLTPTLALDIGAKIRNLFSFLKRKKNENKLKSPKGKIHKKENQETTKKRWRASSTIIIIVVILLIAGLISSIFWLRHSRELKDLEEAYSARIKELRNDLNSAQVNLINGNETKSLEILKAAETKIQQLPRESSNEKANYNELLDQSGSIKNRLIHLEKVSPQLIAEIKSDETGAIKTLSQFGSHVFAAGENGSFQAIDIDDNNAVSFLKSDSNDIYLSASGENNLFLITAEGKLLTYNYSNKKLASTENGWDSGRINDFQIYNEKIYAIVGEKKQVLKSTPGSSGFSSTQSWIKDAGKADLSQAIDLAIDGNIFVLTNIGEVYKFHSGEIQNFVLNPIEPALKAPAKINTGTDLANLYILDSASNRIAVFTKEGKFIKQFEFETLDNPIVDFTVSGDESKIYIATKNKVFKLDLK